MNTAYQSGCNCAGGPNKCSCSDGYTCCSQKGNENFFGLCVKTESGCNKDTGFARIEDKKDREAYNNRVYKENSEYKEGYYESGNKWLLLYILIFIVFLTLIILYFKKR